ncbi:MAG: DEAD/DEAH box helicase [Nitrososphaerota archaeon]|nr:DEAD/DEAH box helicase [Nitrososphaerota archaeon]
MIHVETDTRHKIIRLRTEEPGSLKGGRFGLLLELVLGYELTTNNSAAKKIDGSLGRELITLTKYLREGRIPLSLDEQSKLEMSHYANYVRQFETALVLGKELRKEVQDFHPAGKFTRPLMSFQLAGAKHIYSIPFAANFSVPGSGKTTMVLAAYSKLREENEITKLIVLCPRSAFDPWEEEYQQCYGTRPKTAKVIGTVEERKELFLKQDQYELFLATYQMSVNEFDNFKWVLLNNSCMLVIDESHHIKKGPGGVWFDSIINLAHYAKRRIILSGTPIPNAISDLRWQMELLWPELLRFADIFNTSNGISDINTIRDTIQPLYVRVKKSDLALPEMKVTITNVKMGEVQKKIYKALAADLLSTLRMTPESVKLFRDLRRAKIVRLMQAASNPSLLVEKSYEFKMPEGPIIDSELSEAVKRYSQIETPAKFSKACDLAYEIANSGRKVVLWTNFILNAYAVSNLLKKKGIRTFTVTGVSVVGAVEDDQEELTRERLISGFKSCTEAAALVATVPSIGEAISLHTAAKDAIYIDRTFNCGLFLQSMDRIHRLGLSSEDRANINILISQNTIEEVINRRLIEKMRRMYELLNDDIDVLDMEIPTEYPFAEIDSQDIDEINEYMMREQRNE